MHNLLGNIPSILLIVKKINNDFHIKINMCSTPLLHPSKTHASKRYDHILSQEREEKKMIISKNFT